MKVLFLDDIPQVADAGQVKDVAAGYARNFLLPRGLAVAATRGREQELDQQRQANTRRKAKVTAESKALAELLEGQRVTVNARAGEGGRLYGSITTADIAAALERVTGVPVDRRKIELEGALRTIGDHPVTVRLTHDAVATITVVVEAKSRS